MARTTRRTLLAGGAVALAGCGLLPEEPDPIEASATAAAAVTEAAAGEAGYRLETEDERTIETEVTADVSGDVEINASREVIATVFRRIYARGDAARFGVVTAPLVDLLDGQNLLRDPVAALDDATAIEHATGLTVEGLEADGEASIELLGDEATASRLRGTVEGTAVEILRANVHTRADGGTTATEDGESAGEDGVTAIGVAPAEGGVPPLFGDVRYEK